ncbi:hypothetical protein JOF53_006684 [Crossiella equi]|uniref:Uncharacterized protein n=1 Tax=Crossiella equi TaxID=130796 RepID=A0ABS5ANK0_9PSEU|nr:hypothetical protein [Crossiella equi]MBP2477812.1 hypothetical protein [Crossiella equi]
MPNAAAVSGPGWTTARALPGAPRYPLNVEAPVLAAVERLVPGLDTGGDAEWLTLTGRHTWPAEHRPRRHTLRVLARAAQLLPEADDWQDAVEQAVAYDAWLATDPVLHGLDVAQAWRGVLFRWHAVNAWRRLWARVRDRPEDPYGAIEDLPDTTVTAYLDGLPPLTDPAGHPAPAEQAAARTHPIAGLLLSSRRADTLHGRARITFLGEPGVYLSPSWVAFRAESHDRLPALARRLVDDLFAQERRVLLAHGQLTRGPAAPDPLPLPFHRLGALAEEHGLLARSDEEGLAVTASGRTLLEVGP